MILYRCFAWNARAEPADPDGPLWFPRPFQGEGRHDNPISMAACTSPIVQRRRSSSKLARFRGQRLAPPLLQRRGLPLALATLTLDGRTEVMDLDEPRVLDREGLRPSLVATRDRGTTQPQARTLVPSGIRGWQRCAGGRRSRHSGRTSRCSIVRPGGCASSPCVR